MLGTQGFGTSATRTLAAFFSLQLGDRSGRTGKLETVRAPAHCSHAFIHSYHKYLFMCLLHAGHYAQPWLMRL